jgi:hypothetical protein
MVRGKAYRCLDCANFSFKEKRCLEKKANYIGYYMPSDDCQYFLKSETIKVLEAYIQELEAKGLLV